MRRPSTLHREESGQISVLVLGLLTVVLLLVGVVSGATAVNLEARKLLGAADGAASAAAQQASVSAVGGPGTPGLTEEQARRLVEEHLRDVGAHGRHLELTVAHAGVADGGATVRVRLEASAELPMVSWILPATVPVSAESHARVSINR